MPTDPLDSILPQIAQLATERDRTGHWPDVELRLLRDAGAMRWALPASAGGDDLPALQLHLNYERLASASLAVALLLTQRDSAAALIEAAEGWAARDATLAALARDEFFTTVGIAQLTTSHQRGAPALLATPSPAGHTLTGLIPWSSGPDHARFIIAGASLADRRQILFSLPIDSPGLSIDPPPPLVSLAASQTTSLTCENVPLAAAQILRGPVEKVLGVRPRSLPLGQAFLALGLCRAGLNLIHDHPAGRPAADAFEPQLSSIRAEILAASAPSAPDPADAIPRLRGLISELALRITHAAVALYKGRSLLADHPAQRLAREALFLLVWSCPSPVIDCTVDLLTHPACA